jgi:hypothetical protein
VTAAQVGIAINITCRNTGIVSFRAGGDGRGRLDLRRGGSPPDLRFGPSFQYLRIGDLVRTCYMRCDNSTLIYFGELNALFDWVSDADQRVHGGLLRLSEFAIGRTR